MNIEKLRTGITLKGKLDCREQINNLNEEDLGTLKIVFQTDRHNKRQKNTA